MTNESQARKHVLIVEDELDFASLLRSILVNAGYTVAMAHNFEDALLQVHKSMPDLITLDIHMPRKSGAIFYRKLKADEALRDIPVVVVTGLAQDNEMARILRLFLEADDAAPPEAYVEKPVDGPNLVRTVQEALSVSTCEN